MLSHLISVPGTCSFISAVAKTKRGSRCAQHHAANTWLHAGLARPSAWLMCVLSVGALTNTPIFSRCGVAVIIRLGRSLLEPGVFAGGVCPEGRAVLGAAAASRGRSCVVSPA